MYDTLEEIQGLLGQAEESNGLSFKSGLFFNTISAEATKLDLIKSATAFANASGGTVLFGIAQRLVGAKSIADALEPVPIGSMTKDRLARILSEDTDPPLSDFEIKVIDCPGGSVYALQIAEGHTAFQNRIDRRYYQRVGATTQMMYGYAIRNVMNRRTSPVVQASLGLLRIHINADLLIYRLSPKLANVGALTARHWTLAVDLPEGAWHLASHANTLIRMRDVTRIDGLDFRRFEYSSERCPAMTTRCLLPEEEISLDSGSGFGDLELRLPKYIGDRYLSVCLPLYWSLYVDNAPKRSYCMDFETWCRY